MLSKVTRGEILDTGGHHCSDSGGLGGSSDGSQDVSNHAFPFLACHYVAARTPSIEVVVASGCPLVLRSKFRRYSGRFAEWSCKKSQGLGLPTGTLRRSSQKGKVKWATMVGAICQGDRVKCEMCLAGCLTSSGVPLTIYSIVRGQEKAARMSCYW